MNLKRQKKFYTEALKIYRNLVKINSFIKSNLAMTLNNLANLYNDENKSKEAEKAYIEALNIYKNLAKTNPSTYGFNRSSNT